MENANLVNDPITVDTGIDSIVIKENIEAIRGGKTLDVTGYTQPIIKAGHVVIMETSNEEYKPMPVSGSAYAALPAGHVYVGVMIASILTRNPQASILITYSMELIPQDWIAQDRFM